MTSRNVPETQSVVLGDLALRDSSRFRFSATIPARDPTIAPCGSVLETDRF